MAGVSLDIEAVLRLGTAKAFGLAERVGDGEETLVGYDAVTSHLFVDRTRAGRSDFHPAFAGRHSGPLALEGGLLRLRVLVDAGAALPPTHRDRLALPLRGPRQVLLRQLDLSRLPGRLAVVPGRRLPVDGLAPGGDRPRGRDQHRGPDPDRPPADHRHPHPGRGPRRDLAAAALLPRQPAARRPRPRRAR